MPIAFEGLPEERKQALFEEMCRLRDKLLEKSPLPPFYPRGALRFLRIRDTLFPKPLSPEDRKEAQELAERLGDTALQEYLRAQCPQCGQIHGM